MIHILGSLELIGISASYIFVTPDPSDRDPTSRIFDFTGTLCTLHSVPLHDSTVFLGRHRGKGASGECHLLDVRRMYTELDATSDAQSRRPARWLERIELYLYARAG